MSVQPERERPDLSVRYPSLERVRGLSAERFYAQWVGRAPVVVAVHSAVPRSERLAHAAALRLPRDAQPLLPNPRAEAVHRGARRAAAGLPSLRLALVGRGSRAARLREVPALS